MEFAALPLHDATLESVVLEWEHSICRFRVCPVWPERLAGELVFYDVSELTVPHDSPWGPSVSINETRIAEDGRFEIEMQTGDTLRIRSARFTYERKP
jgi:hypothetical protein